MIPRRDPFDNLAFLARRSGLWVPTPPGMVSRRCCCGGGCSCYGCKFCTSPPPNEALEVTISDMDTGTISPLLTNGTFEVPVSLHCEVNASYSCSWNISKQKISSSPSVYTPDIDIYFGTSFGGWVCSSGGTPIVEDNGYYLFINYGWFGEGGFNEDYAITHYRRFHQAGDPGWDEDETINCARMFNSAYSTWTGTCLYNTAFGTPLHWSGITGGAAPSIARL